MDKAQESLVMITKFTRGKPLAQHAQQGHSSGADLATSGGEDRTVLAPGGARGRRAGPAAGGAAEA